MAKKAPKLTERERDRHAAEILQHEFDKARAMNPEAADAIVYGEVYARALVEFAIVVARRSVDLLHVLEHAVRYASAAVEKWRAEFDKDPAYAFEWATEPAQSAAKAKAWGQLLAMVKERGIGVALRIAREEAMRGARWPSRSTSPMANLMYQTRTAAFAEFVDDFSRYEKNGWALLGMAPETFDVPGLELDMGALGGSLVGESERKVRTALPPVE